MHTPPPPLHLPVFADSLASPFHQPHQHISPSRIISQYQHLSAARGGCLISVCVTTVEFRSCYGAICKRCCLSMPSRLRCLYQQIYLFKSLLKNKPGFCCDSTVANLWLGLSTKKTRVRKTLLFASIWKLFEHQLHPRTLTSSQCGRCRSTITSSFATVIVTCLPLKTLH